MPAALDAALSGMLEQQRRIELIANNLANVNTNGYKRAAVHFQDVLNTAQIIAAINGDLPAAQVTTASGVESDTVERVFTQGPLLPSPLPLDMAIVGEGLFRVRLADGARAVLEPGGTGSVASFAGMPDPATPGVYSVATTAAGTVTVTFTPEDGSAPTVITATVAPGEVNGTLIPGMELTFAGTLTDGSHSIRVTEMAYTRDGGFHLDATRRLVTPDGDVLEPPLVFPETFSRLAVARDGTVTVLRPYTEAELAALPPGTLADGVEVVVGRIGLARFVNPRALASVGGNLFVETAASQPPADGFPGDGGLGRVVSGFVEASNVDLAEEMSVLIVASRAYQMNLSAFKTIQEMLEQVNQLT